MLCQKESVPHGWHLLSVAIRNRIAQSDEQTWQKLIPGPFGSKPNELFTKRPHLLFLTLDTGLRSSLYISTRIRSCMLL